MRGVSAVGRVLGICLLIGLLVPVVAPWPSALLDRGPEGLPRVSLFPLALTVLDPLVWAGAVNSLMVAAVVTVGSLVAGVSLGRIAGRWRFWGRAPLWTLALAPLFAGPLWVSLGIADSLIGTRGWDWLASRSLLGISADEGARWLALTWSGIAVGTPLVALATASALRRVDPTWSDSARAIGVLKRRIWRDLTWPIVRPEVARSSALVFTLTLVEPVGPLVFSLRRTFAVQILDASARFDSPNRAACLALLAIAIAAVGRTLIGWWGGPSIALELRPDVAPIRPASARRGWVSSLVLAAWALASAGPMVLFFRQWLGPIDASATNILASIGDGETGTWAANSALTATLAVGLDLLVLGACFSRRTGSGSGMVRRAARWLESTPPLALGVGALCLPWLLLAGADAMSANWPIVGALRGLSRELSPGRAPGFLLILALAATRLPMLVVVAEMTRGLARPSQQDAARLMGATDGRASKAGVVAAVGGIPAIPALIAVILATCNLSTAWVLTPFSERRTLGPAALTLWLDSGPRPPGRAGPFLALAILGLVAMALASWSSRDHRGEWFRGP